MESGRVLTFETGLTFDLVKTTLFPDPSAHGTERLLRMLTVFKSTAQPPQKGAALWVSSFCELESGPRDRSF